MQLKDILDKTTAFFKEKGLDTPRLDAELLISYGLNLERIQLYLKFDQPMKESELTKLRELVRRRSQGEPVAYILGQRDFYGHSFNVTPDVLIPRPETEHVVEEALNWAEDKSQPYGIIDLGCGSGCLGLSVLYELPQAFLITVDISEKALAVARQNAEAMGLSKRVTFVHGDAGDMRSVMSAYTSATGRDKVDILVSNPPYIAQDDQRVESSVHKFEPHSALYADENGMALLKLWTEKYAPHLNEKSLMAMEMGLDQGPEMMRFYQTLKTFNKINVIKDLAGHDRVIRGEK